MVSEADAELPIPACRSILSPPITTARQLVRLTFHIGVFAMEKNTWHAAAGKAAVGSLLLLSINMVSQPCLAQYTAGHAVQECGLQQTKNYSYCGATHLQGATMGTIGPDPSYLQAATMGTIAPTPPQLQGATMGTIGPQGDDATYVVGVNTAGTVRVNMLAMLEALFNNIANGAQIITVLWGSFLMLGVINCMFKERYGLKRCFTALAVSASFLCTGLGIVTNLLNSMVFLFDPPWKRKNNIQVKFWLSLLTVKAGLLIPTCVNWLIAAARDANLFS